MLGGGSAFSTSAQQTVDLIAAEGGDAVAMEADICDERQAAAITARPAWTRSGRSTSCTTTWGSARATAA